MSNKNRINLHSASWNISTFVRKQFDYFRMNKTDIQFEKAIELCKSIFKKKLTDYGAAWRIMRPSSLTDQIFIKANRIRTLETVAEQKVEDNIADEFIGIVNYSIVGIIQIKLGAVEKPDISNEEALKYYEKYATEALNLMQAKNHDYNEAWRSMRISSYTDLILMKINRTKQIEDNFGKTIISEGIDANYFDMVNYAVFALIQMGLTENSN